MCKRAEVDLEDFDVLFGENSNSIEKNMLSNGKVINVSDFPVTNIELDKIDDFPSHPFKVQLDEDMEKLIENIRIYGVMHPVIVRKINDRYQMISGHRRRFASLKAGKDRIPARIMELTDEDAAILMADANFLQRTKLLPSEKALAYRMKYDAIKSQGKRGTGRSLSEIGEALGEGEKTVQRLIRLSYLIKDLLDLVDEGKLGIIQGTDISYLKEDDQAHVLFIIKMHNLSITKEQSEQLKKLSGDGNISFDSIQSILLAKKKTERKLNLNKKKINEYFDESYSSENIEKLIYELLDKWKEGKISVNSKK